MKDNKTFLTLSGIGIIMVVIGHVNNSIDLLNSIFPYNSFFMPMFMFISGYFFKDKNVETLENTKTYIKKKVKNLLVYYLIWNIIYGVINTLLYNLELFRYHLEINFRTIFISPFITGQQFWINSPAWFIPVLFTVEIVFLAIRKLQLLSKGRTEYVSLFILMIINVMTVYISQKIQYVESALPLLKLGFFIFFFQLGKIYKDEIEEKETKIKNEYVFLITILINLICIKLYKNIGFPSLYNMGGFGSLPPFVPIITSITGIWFWLRISRIISPILTKSKIFNKIANDTKSIMMHHIFCMLIINIILYGCNDILNLKGFDVFAFKNNPMWYRYYAGCPQLGIIYIIVGIYGSLKILDIENVIKVKIKEKSDKYGKTQREKKYIEASINDSVNNYSSYNNISSNRV